MRKLFYFISSLILILMPATANAIIATDRHAVINNTTWYDPYACSGDGGTGAAVTTSPPVPGSPEDEAKWNEVLKLAAKYPPVWLQFLQAARNIAQQQDYPISVIVGQAALESAHGTSNISKTKFNFFGFMAYDSNTNAARPYTSPAESIADYVKLIKTGNGGKNSSYLAAYAARADPRKMIELIKAGGYATDPDYVNKVTGIPEFRLLAGVSLPGGGADPGTCAAPTAATTGGCTNPMTDPLWKNALNRTDDGVDYGFAGRLPSGTAINAPCDLTIIDTTSSAGWPGGGFVYARITSGPFKDKCWYIAEDIKDLPANGTKIAAGQKVVSATGGGDGIEVGFAKAMRLSAMSVGAAGYPGPSGRAVAKFLRSLGAPTRDDPGANAPDYAGGVCPPPAPGGF